jgi:hypothetical protein
MITVANAALVVTSSPMVYGKRVMQRRTTRQSELRDLHSVFIEKYTIL